MGPEAERDTAKAKEKGELSGTAQQQRERVMGEPSGPQQERERERLTNPME